MNIWTLTYTVACLVLAIAILRSRGISTRPDWPRLATWWLSSSVCALVLWSTLACSALPLFGEISMPQSPMDWGACVVGSAFWATFVVALALPFYGLLLTWYIIRFGRELGGRPAVARNAALLGLPPAAMLLYGYAFPVHGGMGASLLSAVPFACLGFLTATAGLLLPRIGIRRLGPGRLLRANAA